MWCTNLLWNKAIRLVVGLPVCLRTIKMPENISFQEMAFFTLYFTVSCFFLEGHILAKKRASWVQSEFNSDSVWFCGRAQLVLCFWKDRQKMMLFVDLEGWWDSCVFCFACHLHSYTSTFVEFEQVGLFFLPKKTSCAILLSMVFSIWKRVTVPPKPEVFLYLSWITHRLEEVWSYFWYFQGHFCDKKTESGWS